MRAADMGAWLELLIFDEGLVNGGGILSYAGGRGMLLVDLSGRIRRAAPQLEQGGIRLALEAEGLGDAYSLLAGLLREVAGRGICVYSMSAIWALAYRELGPRLAPQLLGFMVQLREAAKAEGSELCVAVEEWFQRKHRYVYNVARAVADRVFTPP